jgi:hypothetical protein
MIPMLALPLALAACGDPAPQNVAAPVPQAPSAFQNQVAALDDGPRNAVFIRAIRDAGQDCQQVTKSEAKGDGPGGDPLWHATCSGGATYGVLIGRDGTATVIAAQ